MNKSAKFWNNRAKSFDKHDNPLSDARKERYERIKTYLNKSQLVMDYGCATGSISQEIANTVREVHGVDISSEMIKLAQKKAKDNNYHNIKYVEGDIQDEKFDSSKYDVIIAFYVLHLVSDPEKTLNRITALLNTEGFLILEAPCSKQANFLKKFVIKTFSKLSGLPYLRDFSQNQLEKMVNDAGLNIVETDFKNDKFPRTFIAAKK